MKNRLLLTGVIVALIALTYNPSVAQGKVTEKKLIGTWKLVIEIEDELEEARQEMDDEDNVLGELILSGVSGLVEGIMDNIEIYFEFRPGGEVVIMAEAFGNNDDEDEYARWEINKRGELIISDMDNISINDDDYWLMDSRYLISYDENGEKEENVYMRKVE